MPKIRVRNHVNPLSQKYQTPTPPPNWSEIYPLPNQPFHLDIGCGKGQFLLQMAQIQPERNFLGLEIREPLVRYANFKAKELELTNLHYLYGNINSSLQVILQSLPLGILQWVTIQFPDPWFKRRHSKRRIVQPQLVNLLAHYLNPMGTVFLQSDIKTVAVEMVHCFQQHPNFQRKHPETWLPTNPFPVPTEREKFTLSRSQPVYRALFNLIIPPKSS